MLQVNEIRNRCRDKLLVLLFWALWYPESEVIRLEMERLAPNLRHLKLCWCDVDKDKEIIDEYEVYQVPYILFQHPHEETLEQVRNPNRVTLGKILHAYDEYYH